MIDVMKRLAELDATKSSIEKPNLAECGPMSMMDGMGEMGQPHSPASINMTAATGEELSGMLKDIMSLAGLSKVEPEHLGIEPEPTMMTAEPVTSVGPTSDTEVMRGVIDKLNPETDDEHGMEHDDELGSFQHDDSEEDEEETDEGAIGAGLGGLAGGSLGKMGGAALGGMLGGPIGAALGGVAGDVVGTGMGAQAGDKMTGEEYDNSPADPRKPPPFRANQFANRTNQPGQGDRMDGTSPKAYADMNEAVADLFAEYKKFIGESAKKKIDNKDVAEGSLNEDPGFSVVKSLVSAFNDSVSGDANIPLAAERPGSRVLTRSDGTRYRDHGNIRFYQGYIDPQDVAKWKATKPVEKFWDWLNSQPGVKPIGQVSGEFRQDVMRDAVTYKGQYFVLTPNGSVIWGSVSRFKNPRSVWRHQDPEQGMPEDIEDRLKDLDPKNPVNVPAYQRKAASGDSANAARNTKEGATEKFDPLKHVKNPTQGEKDAAKDVKRGSYSDRAAMLKSAEADGRLKSESANESISDILKLSGLK